MPDKRMKRQVTGSVSQTDTGTDTLLRPRRAVFLDRDGVINRPVVREGKPYTPSSLVEFEILPGVPKACHALKELGFLLVVATNQPDVGRGILAREAVETIHG